MKELRREPNYKEAYRYLVKWIRGLPFDLDESDREKLHELGMDYEKKIQSSRRKPIIYRLFLLDTISSITPTGAAQHIVSSCKITRLTLLGSVL